MTRKVYLNLLVLCAILFHVIIATFADEDIRESSNLLVRQKRVVSHLPGEDKVSHIEDYPYVVHIKKLNRISCVGSIISHRVVITAAQCAQYEPAVYKVVSNSARSNRGAIHDVSAIKLHYGNHPGRHYDGIALLTVSKDFEFSEYIKKIDLHVGPLLPGMHGFVSGWGFNFRNDATTRGTKYPTELRTIQVPIIAHQNCVNAYKRYFPISDMDICTFHPQRHSGHNDAGAPLVIDGLLVGIFLRSGPLHSIYNPLFPDIFALLQHMDYSRWIRNNI